MPHLKKWKPASGKLFFCLALAIGLAVLAADPQPCCASHSTEMDALLDLSLAELMDQKITLTTRTAQKLSETAAAAYVITQEDLRRSSFTTVAEALRLAPGLHVARIDGNNYVITARGFSRQFSNKVTVLMDGRSIASPIFSGPVWGALDTLIEDVDRIEVILGPGGTLWGSNAVNGIINIVTKDAAATQGPLYVSRFSSTQENYAGIRYGGMLDDAHYRIYSKYSRRGASDFGSGQPAEDDMENRQAGFRVDWDVSPANALMVQGELYNGDQGQTATEAQLTPPYSREVADNNRVAGGNAFVKWEHDFSERSDMALQLFFNRESVRRDGYKQSASTYDLDFQHTIALRGGRHRIVYGFGSRSMKDSVEANFASLAFNPSYRHTHYRSAFLADDIELIAERLRLQLHVKIDDNAFTGFEMQPGVRLAWTPSERKTIWAAVSQAVSEPSRLESDLRYNFIVIPPGQLKASQAGLPVVAAIFGDNMIEAEEVLAYELGYREKISDALAVGISAYYNRYNHLSALEVGSPYVEASPAPIHLTYPIKFGGTQNGKTYGVELSSEWQVSKSWDMKASYTDFQFDLKNNGAGLAGGNDSPQRQFRLQSHLDVSKKWEFNSFVHYVSRLGALRVPGYIRTDVQFCWKPDRYGRVSFGAQNLFDDRHEEYRGAATFQPTQSERSLYFKWDWER